MPKTRLQPDLEFRIVNADRDAEDFLPNVIQINGIDDALSQPAGGSFTYLREGINAGLLVEKGTIVIERTGLGPSRNNRFTLQGRAEVVVGDGDDALAGVEWHITSLLQRLGDAAVMPHEEDILAKPYVYAGETAGLILQDHIDRAKGQGEAIPELHFGTFDADLTSTGFAWTRGFTGKVDPGISLLELFNLLRDAQCCDFYMVDDDVYVVNWGYGVDHLADVGDPGADGVVLWAGQDLLNGESTRDASTFCNAVQVFGDGGKRAIVKDADSIAAVGDTVWRTVNATGIADVSKLTTYGQIYLSVYARVRESLTYDVVQGWGTDAYDTAKGYNVGDTIGIMDPLFSGVGPRSVRVVQLTTSSDEDSGAIQVALTVNDWFETHELVALERLAAMTRGADGPTGGALPGRDTMPPSPPKWPIVGAITTSTYLPPTGTGGGARARLDLTVALPTRDGNGVDLLGDYSTLVYEWKYAGRPGWIQHLDPDGTATISNLDTNRSVNVRVKARDTSGNDSVPTITKTVTTAGDYGGWRSYDATTGEVLYDSRAGDRVSIPARFTIGHVPGSTFGLASLDAATGAGVELSEVYGARLWDAAGLLSIHLDAATGDLWVSGNATIDGFVSIGGNVLVTGTVHIHGDPSALFDGSVTIAGNLTVTADFDLVGNMDASGSTITGGTFVGATLTSATIGAVTITSIVYNTLTMSIAGNYLTPSLGPGHLAGGWVSDADFHVTGTLWADGPFRHTGSTLAFYSGIPAAFTAIDNRALASAADRDAVIISMRSRLQAVHIG